MTLWICSHKTILRESSDRNPQREDVITPEGVDGRSVGPLFRFEILTAPRPLKRVLHFAILHSSSVFRQWQRRRKWSNKVTNGPERHLTAADLVGLECLLRSVFGLPTATDNRGPSPRQNEIARSFYGKFDPFILYPSVVCMGSVCHPIDVPRLEYSTMSSWVGTYWCDFDGLWRFCR